MIPYRSSLPKTGPAERMPPAPAPAPAARKGLLDHIAEARRERLQEEARRPVMTPAMSEEQDALLRSAVFTGSAFALMAYLIWDMMDRGLAIAFGIAWLFWTVIVFGIKLRRIDRARQQRAFAELIAQKMRGDGQ